jgi:hypothetical protein
MRWKRVKKENGQSFEDQVFDFYRDQGSDGLLIGALVVWDNNFEKRFDGFFGAIGAAIRGAPAYPYITERTPIQHFLDYRTRSIVSIQKRLNA